jgi:hypothetical protein
MKTMKHAALLAAALAVSAPAFGQISYSEDFEGLDPTPGSTSLGDSGWLVFVNVFADYPGCTPPPLYGYGFPAVVSNDQIVNLVAGQTGQAINVFTDFSNRDAQDNGQCVESNVFQERTLTAADLGSYTFSFDTEVPQALDPDVSTIGFIKLLDPNNGFNLDLFLTVDTASAGAKSIDFDLDDTAVGKLLQFGFANFASNDNSSGRWYDNVEVGPQAVEPPVEPPVTPPPSNVEGVPTLDHLGLALLALLVAGLGLFAVNRRF